VHLRDISKEVTAAWKIAFADVPQVQVTCGNILEHPGVPGMGTGIGQVPPARAARQMRFAYDTVLGRGDSQGPDARRILRQHRDMLA
jgi:O-acetyl-ADP-ribose deacetylase (regulator of RNase III)